MPDVAKVQLYKGIERNIKLNSLESNLTSTYL